MCLEVNKQVDVDIYHCHGTGGNQAFVYTQDNRILSSSTNCIAADLKSGFLYATYCVYKNSSIYWNYDERVCRIHAFNSMVY